MRPSGLLARLPVALLLLSVLGGCRFSGDLIAAGAGGVTAAATANPAVGILVGVAVNSAIDATFAYAGRKRQQAEQDAIAAVVATMHAGDHESWRIQHVIPIGNEHGDVEVTREITTPLTQCKELAFSVQSGEGPNAKEAWYVTQVCRDGTQWKWAFAEPATERWDSLQ